MASSAAPIILPLAKVNDPNIKGAHTYYADGGLWANNPVLIGLIEALEMSDLDQPIEIVTIGTCSPPRGTVIEGSENSMGLYAWRGGVNVLDLSMDAQSSGYEYMAHHFAKQCRKLKKEITVERIDHSPPSSDQARLLSLDNASESACQVLIGRGLTDALAIHGKATSGDGSYPVISAIFSSLPKLNNEVS